MTKGRRGVKVLFVVTLVIAVLLAVYPQPCHVAPPSADLNLPNPIPLSQNLDIEKMTWMEVRDRIAAGYSRIIVPTGGIEQNGPFVALNKHDLIAHEVSQRVARSLGGTLLAPVVSFVFEGAHSPPSGHMQYPGTISVSSETFQRLMRDIIASLEIHGFKEIVLVGDSFDTQRDLERIANEHAAQSEGAFVRYVPAFYNYEEVRKLLRDRGIEEKSEPFHEELAFTAQLMAIDPSAVRYNERIAIGASTLGGFPLGDQERLRHLGEEVLAYRATRVIQALQSRN